jgi:transcription elongation factor Elf1
MEIACPHCDHRHVDDWEVLQSGDAGPITCEACGKVFLMQVWECRKCEDHVATTSIDEGASPELVLVGAKCSSCGALYEQKQSTVDILAEGD